MPKMTWQFCLLSVIRYPESAWLLHVVQLRKIIVSAGGKKKRRNQSHYLKIDQTSERIFSCHGAAASHKLGAATDSSERVFFSGNHRLELLRMAPSAREGRYRRLLLLTGKESAEMVWV